MGSVFVPWEMHSPLFRFFCVRHQNWTKSVPVSCSFTDHDWGRVDLSATRKVRSGKMKASGKPSGPIRGCDLSKAFCIHYDRLKIQNMSSVMQSYRMDSRLSE